MGQISDGNPDERAGANNVPICYRAYRSSQFSVVDGHRSEHLSDDQIKLAIVNALHWDLAVPRDRVQASVNHGWVTLTGQVRHEYERSRAEADARTMQGVIGVTNEIIRRSSE